MKGYVQDIGSIAVANDDFRRVLQPLKLYTLYAPPTHRDGVVHPARAQAQADNEHYDGKATE